MDKILIYVASACYLHNSSHIAWSLFNPARIVSPLCEEKNVARIDYGDIG